MNRLLLPALLLAFVATGCGPTSNEVADATIHHCEMTRLEAEMAADPSRTDLRDEYIERSQFLSMVVETSRDPDGLRAKLASVTCD